MSALSNWFLTHASHAPWISFGLVILAGCNLPISIDLVFLLTAVVAATIIPEKIFHLYFALFAGCCISAWVSYWIGRTLGAKLMRYKWFAKIANPNRMVKMHNFYEKYGFLALMFGRFIPFGVRNCMFMSTGMSRIHFGKFVFRDFFACLIWSSILFFIFYSLGQNYQTLYEKFKTFNIVIFSALSVTGIGLIWYKLKKRKLLLAKQLKEKAENTQIETNLNPSEVLDSIPTQEDDRF